MDTIASGPQTKEQALHDAVGRVGTAVSPIRGEIATTGSARGHGATITAAHRMPAQPADYATFPPTIDARLRAALGERGITRPYTHQAAAIEAALEGRHVVVVTPTASGKTLCYNVPVLHRILTDSSTRALYLFPTKALAQDQLAELHGLSEAVSRSAGTEIGVFTYDGDTPQDARRSVRGRAHVVLSNPDMLHSGILPHHPRWAKLFEGLRFVVIDELHTYRGVFGSHLANVLRRLRRVCRHYGSNPVFVCSSATIANPRELAQQLTGEAFSLVAESGAPRGEKLFVFVNPPVVNAQLGIRRSYLAETRRVALEFLRRQLQVIVFAQSRLATEILTTYLKNEFPAQPGMPEPIRGYRGGYLPLRRREIESGLRRGQVRGVVSTNALELGIDIGALDVCVMAGYPGTIAGTWQRAGRAGRRAGCSAAILVASSAPLDQFMVRNPDYFFSASPERALVNPDNLSILLDHIKCAAFELPFDADEAFGVENVQAILELLSEEGFVHRSSAGWHWTHESYPADAVSLRSVSSDNFVVVDATGEPRVIGEVDFSSGTSTLHEKAIYIVEGQLFQVKRLDFDGRKAHVERVECDYYTDAITYTKVSVIDVFDTGGPGVTANPAAGDLPTVEDSPEADDSPPVARGNHERTHGEVHVTSRVVGFKKIKFYTNENVGSGELDLPERQMHTSAYWLTVAPAMLEALPHSGAARRDGIVGLAHAMRNVAQLILMCDRHDVGVSIDGIEEPTERPASHAAPVVGQLEPRIFVYDNYPGGIGFSEPLFTMHEELLRRTHDLISGCPCEAGCPSCIGPAADGGGPAKAVAARLLELMVSEAPPGAVTSAPSASAVAESGRGAERV